ncbi:MAG: hypothetical protein C4521_12365 [Actinobacteria bacterium]|nr:MAG: hypothetical protein C4521_12365 [Actinomycetota bacterium]
MKEKPLKLAQILGCLKLCEAVLRRAAEDAKNPNPKYDDIYLLKHEKPQQFWMPGRKGLSTKRSWFRWYCEVLGLNPDRFINLLVRIRNECKFKQTALAVI